MSRHAAAFRLPAAGRRLVAAVVVAFGVGAFGVGAWTGVATAASGGVHRHDGRSETSTQQGSGHSGGHGDMPGMDHGSDDEMAGMDHGSGDEMPGMNHDAVPMSVLEPERPLGLVLGGFGTATAAVLVAAALLRRQDLINRTSRRAARAEPRP